MTFKTVTLYNVTLNFTTSLTGYTKMYKHHENRDTQNINDLSSFSIAKRRN